MWLKIWNISASENHNYYRYVLFTDSMAWYEIETYIQDTFFTNEVG